MDAGKSQAAQAQIVATPLDQDGFEVVGEDLFQKGYVLFDQLLLKSNGVRGNNDLFIAVIVDHFNGWY